MGIAYNAAIVRDNLVLCLDAANPKNYNLTEVEVLVVAGGGGAGHWMSGGGGGGGVIYNRNFTVTPGSALTTTVGGGGANAGSSGGSQGSNGENSVFGSLTATGGGGGGGINALTGRNGASGGGGGGGYSGGSGGSGTSGQGFAGGNGTSSSGAGGGGSGSIGSNGGINLGGNGGVGLGFNISGTFTYYAGGGGGGTVTTGTAGTGGLGGGGNGSTSTGSNGSANTGGGGGGGGEGPAGGNGGSGIVIVRYSGPQKAIGGTITSNNGYTIHTFTTSSTFTPLVATNNSAILGLSDFSGGGNFGTSVNGPTYNSANGGSLSFDGVDDYVNCGTPSISAGKITVNAWVKINAGSITQHVVDSASNAWHLAILNSNRPYFWNGSVYHQASPILTVGQWYMLTGVQGTTLDIYINGVLGQSIVTNVNVTTNNVNLGRYQSGGRQLNGNISQVSIYNRALTAAEVRQNYNAVRARYEKGGIDNPFSSPTEARILGYASGDYYFKSGSMSSPQLLEFQRDYYENRGWVCVFRSPYRSTATTNRIGLNIPMGGLLVQRDALDLRAAVYWSTPITYNTVGGAGNNTADSGYSPRRVILGGSGGHGIFATNQNQCSWGTATGAIGAGWDGSTCGSFPNDLVWGTGRSDTATYENRSGIWSHWITWN